MEDLNSVAAQRPLARVIADAFAPVIGSPCWNAKQGFGSFLFQQNSRRVDSESSRQRIARALLDLDGQALTEVSVSPDLRQSVFQFDLGGRLETTASNDEQDSHFEQWMLFEPSGVVLTLRADGHYCRGPGETPPELEVWHSAAAP